MLAVNEVKIVIINILNIENIISDYKKNVRTFQMLTFFLFYGIYNHIVKKIGVETMNHQDILKLQEKIKSISDLKAKIENNEIKKESLSLEQLNDLNFFYAVNIKKKQQINRVKKEKLIKMRENEI